MFSVFLLFACWVNAQETGNLVPVLPDQPYQYADIDLPAHFTSPDMSVANVVALDNTPVDNPLTDAGATLGRVLFYDKRLSLNESVSCSSCHQQAHGFSDPATFSVGFNGGLTARHSMGLSNARYYERGHFFRDERADTLEDQVVTRIQDPVEMNMDLDALVSRLEQTEFYPALFEAAFSDALISAERISLALSQFVRSLVSYQSKFDLALSTQGNENGGLENVLTTQEQLGHNLFASVPDSGVDSLGCDRCHATHAQISGNVENNGLDLNTDADQGAGGGRFKSPSLRDIATRPPYMHDGRFESLQEVVEFYNSGIQDHPQLSPQLREGPDGNGEPLRFNLDDGEKAALVAFLKTLTDPFLLNDIRFSDPFAEPVASLDVFSGSWYDPSHDGEGWIVEVLDDETAVIYWFTYDQQGNQAWLIGIAERDGNTLNADMLLTSGPVFGADYDLDSLVYEAWGTLSFRIDGCRSGFLEYASVVAGYGSGSLEPQRLVTIDGLDCEQLSTPATSRFSGWSGSWYDPSHDGEGWIIQGIDDTSAVIYWFTYDSTGEQAWLVGVAQRSGNSLRADMQITSGAEFGPGFDPADVEFSDWGTVEITFSSCKSANLNYTSLLPEFGSGSLQPQRLTTLAGHDCVEAPNILMVIADDFGLDAFAAYDPGIEVAATPVLSDLAAEGLLFDQFWSNPSCSPTRAALITGRYGVHTGVLLVGDVLDDSELTIQDHLEQNLPGYYANAVIGKWHLGQLNDRNHPAQMGVQYFAGDLNGRVNDYTNWTLTENGQQTTSTEYATSKFIDLSIDWVGQQTQPWFLWLAMNAPHEPFHLPPAHLHSRNLSGTPEDIAANPLPYYLAMIEAMDTEIGRLLDSMDSATRENTLIIFLGDNGTQRSVIQAPYTRAQGKGSLFQGGINTPLFVAGAGVDRHGQREDALVGATDLFASIAKIAGVSNQVQNDSISFASLLTAAGDVDRDYLYSDKRDDELQSWAIRNQRYKLIADQQGRQEIYDLQLDPWETTDMVASGSASAELISELETAAAQIRETDIIFLP